MLLLNHHRSKATSARPWVGGPWQRRYLLALRARNLQERTFDDRYWLSVALARIIREEMRQNNDDETELVATLLLSSRKRVPPCAESDPPAHRNGYKRGAMPINKADASHHQGHRQSAHGHEGRGEGRTPAPVMTKTPSSKSPFLRGTVSTSPAPLPKRRVITLFSPYTNDRPYTPPPPPSAASPTGMRPRGYGGSPRCRSLINDLLHALNA